MENEDEETAGPTEAVEILIEAAADSAEAVEAMADTAEAVEAVFLSDRMEDKDAKYKLLLKTLRSGQSY